MSMESSPLRTDESDMVFELTSSTGMTSSDAEGYTEFHMVPNINITASPARSGNVERDIGMGAAIGMLIVNNEDDSAELPRVSGSGTSAAAATRG